MLTVFFQGWFQCRLATDPDRYDHPRGDRGWTFAAPGEPDLDRVIRFHNPVAMRSYGPRVGVYVTEVRQYGAVLPHHPLQAAPVRLLASPTFEGCSGRIGPSAQEPIVPFHLRIEGNGVCVERCDPFNPEARADRLRRRPVLFEGQSEEVARVTGIRNPHHFRAERRACLETELAVTRNPQARQALERRIEELEVQSGVAVASLGFRSLYRFPLGGETAITDPAGLLDSVCHTQPWQLEFWMGAWDADALCGFVQGALELAPADSRATSLRGRKGGVVEGSSGLANARIEKRLPAPAYTAFPSHREGDTRLEVLAGCGS